MHDNPPAQLTTRPPTTKNQNNNQTTNRNVGCALLDCQLCRNNPAKACGPSGPWDDQYWVRDDGRGGQVLRARCGADVGVRAVDRATGRPLAPPGLRLRLYVVDGASAPLGAHLASAGGAGSPGISSGGGGGGGSAGPSRAGARPSTGGGGHQAPLYWEAANEGLYAGDDGKPLFCVSTAGAAIEEDGAVPLDALVAGGGLGGGGLDDLGRTGSRLGTPAPSGGGGGLSRAASDAAGLLSPSAGDAPSPSSSADAVVAPVPELQFLNKNSRFRASGRVFKSFRLRVVATWAPLPGGGGGSGGGGGISGASPPPGLPGEALAAVLDSEPFKVTTKKGYDGCRKADYLNAREPLTDKAFAALGETTIANLKTRFPGAASTVGDLAALVDAAAGDADLEARLRDVLNMSRDADKWRALRRALRERVVRDDATPRVWALPLAAAQAQAAGQQPPPPPLLGLALLYRAQKGAVDLGEPVGILLGDAAAAAAAAATARSS